MSHLFNAEINRNIHTLIRPIATHKQQLLFQHKGNVRDKYKYVFIHNNLKKVKSKAISVTGRGDL
jgi:hypothetical protein